MFLLCGDLMNRVSDQMLPIVTVDLKTLCCSTYNQQSTRESADLFAGEWFCLLGRRRVLVLKCCSLCCQVRVSFLIVSKSSLLLSAFNSSQGDARFDA
jgi:hypothetical protein